MKRIGELERALGLPSGDPADRVLQVAKRCERPDLAGLVRTIELFRRLLLGPPDGNGDTLPPEVARRVREVTYNPHSAASVRRALARMQAIVRGDG